MTHDCINSQGKEHSSVIGISEDCGRSDPSGYYFAGKHAITGRVTPLRITNSCVKVLKALGEETRARIVELLLKDRRPVGEIAQALSVSQYNVSRHLRILHDAGLLEVEKQGRQRLYSVRARFRRANLLDLGCCTFQFNAAPRPAAEVSELRLDN